jgi:hypothetical protein
MSQRYPAGFITASYTGLQVPDAPTIGLVEGEKRHTPYKPSWGGRRHQYNQQKCNAGHGMK